MEAGRKIFFLADAHLGTPDHSASLEREKRLTRFLEGIRAEASDIYFLGDIFDFWFEYKRVVPKGFTRFFGKLAELSDSGVRLHFITGNHDIWVYDYFPSEIGMEIHREPVVLEEAGKRLFLAHGDGLDESDRVFRWIKGLFTNRALQWAFARLHPNFAIWLAHGWSRRSRVRHGEEAFRGEDEPIIRYSRKHLIDKNFDYLVFGHRHTPVAYPLNDRTRLLILGDWISHFTYGVFDGRELTLEAFVRP